MENQNIIFEVPEETTPTEIIIEILEKNGFADPTDDAINNELPRIVLVDRALKDFINKKIDEAGLGELLQSKIKIKKEAADGIIKGLKASLLPYAKKITIQENSPTLNISSDIEQNPIGGESKSTNITEMPQKTKGTKIKETLPPIKKITPQKSGQDRYREPL